MRDRQNLAGDILLLRGRVGITEQELRTLPRLRRRRRRTELATQLETDRRQLDTAYERLQHLDEELHTLKGTLEDVRAEALRTAAPSQTTYGRSMERTPQPILGSRAAPAQADPYRSPTRPLAEPHERGYGIEF